MESRARAKSATEPFTPETRKQKIAPFNFVDARCNWRVTKSSTSSAYHHGAILLPRAGRVDSVYAFIEWPLGGPRKVAREMDAVPSSSPTDSTAGPERRVRQRLERHQAELAEHA
jgi:hypothetical protein